MKTQSEINRQYMGCGYAPSPPVGSAIPVRPWDHEGRVPNRDEVDAAGKVLLPICPGFACGLPEVIEASWAHAYWDKGELEQFCDGGASTPMLRRAIGELASEQNKVQAWEMNNPESRR
jgi:hypothetical protein